MKPVKIKQLNMADENGKTLANITVESESVECVESLIMLRRFNSWNVPEKNDDILPHDCC